MLDPSVGVLEFVSVFEATVAAQVARGLSQGENDVTAELGVLVDAGLARRVRVADDLAPVFRVTDAGRRQVEPRLPDLRALDLARMRHWIGTSWCWLAAKEGAFGRLRLVLSSRQMVLAERSGALAGLFPDHAVRAFGRRLSPGAAPVYPDLALVPASAGFGQVPLHLELASAPDVEFWRRLMVSYEQDANVEAVLVLALSQQIRDALETVAETMMGDAVKSKLAVRLISGGQIGFGAR